MIYARYRIYAKERLCELKPHNRYDGDLRDKNVWIYGDPGTGKSVSARYCDERHIYLKNMDKWWDGYEDHKVVLIEDVDPITCKEFANEMKKWCDRFSFRAECKGSHVIVNPVDFNLIVTSNYSIDECFSRKDAIAIKRRFTEMEFN